MSSTYRIDFSVRPNKAIERSIVFDSLREYASALSLRNPAYVGFGSVWFTDFVLAHKRLKITKMVSIEKDPITFSRARFNRPYRFIEIAHGESTDVLPELLHRRGFKASPWIVWLDYDGKLCSEMLDDIDLLLDGTPPDSVLLVTFNARSGAYDPTTAGRRDELKELFPDADINEADLTTNSSFAKTLQQLLIDHMVSITVNHGRTGATVPAFNISYEDSTWMGTVGVLLPRPANVASATTLVATPSWRGMPSAPIRTPLLTGREVAALQSELPNRTGLTERHVRKLGFELEKAKIDAYVTYYSDYPTFVQVGP